MCKFIEKKKAMERFFIHNFDLAAQTSYTINHNIKVVGFAVLRVDNVIRGKGKQGSCLVAVNVQCRLEFAH